MRERFVEMLERNAAHAAAYQDRFEDVQTAQHPDAVTVCCSDSRVLQDRMWGNDEPGRIFTCSNIGNRVMQRTASGTTVSGDVLYPIEHTGTDTVIVVGHTGCGAATATYDAILDGASEPPGIEHCLSVLKPHLESGVDSLPESVGRQTAIDYLIEYNVDRQVEFLGESDDVPADVDVYGVVYDFQDVYPDRRGAVHVINVEGVTDVERLRARYPEIESRIRRLWEY